MKMKMILLVLAVLRVSEAANKCKTMESDYALKGWKPTSTPPTGGCLSLSNNIPFGDALEAGESCTVQCNTDDPDNAFYPYLGNDFELVCPSAAASDESPKGATECLKLIRGSEAKRTYKQVWDNSAPPPLSMLDSTYAWVGCNNAGCGNNGISCSPGQLNNPCADQWMMIETEPASTGGNPWVQGLVTQGRSDQSQYVTRFKVQVTARNDANTGLIDVRNALDNTLFFDSSGTSVKDKKVFQYFDKPYQAKYIKIMVLADSGYRAMRAAYLVCGNGFIKGCTPPTCTAGEFGRIGACKECPNGFKTSASSQTVCAACADGKYNIGAKQSACPDTCESVQGQATSATLTCTSASDSRISACTPGLYKTVGVAGTSDTCTACTSVADMKNDAAITCTGPNDSRVTACAAAHFQAAGSTTTGSLSSDKCTACTTVANAASDASYTCTSATDSKVSACAAGYDIKTKTAPDTGNTCVLVDQSDGAIWTASLLGSLLSSFIVVLASGRLLY